MSKSVKFRSNKIINPKTDKEVIVDTDVMHQCGYFDLKDKTKEERIKILNEVLKKIEPLKVFRILNYLAIVNKHHEQIFLNDRDYISTKLHPVSKLKSSIKSGTIPSSVKLIKSKSNKLPVVSVSKSNNRIKSIITPIASVSKKFNQIKSPVVSISKNSNRIKAPVVSKDFDHIKYKNIISILNKYKKLK
jgi:hypothetical protein